MSENLGSAPLPSVGVVIATQDRIELLKRAINSVLNQDYDGQITVYVIYDNYPISPELELTEVKRAVRIFSNTRQPGLAGARNTGILSCTTDLIAFCDDDDAWKPQKLILQVARMRAEGSQGCVSGIEIEYGEKRITRIPNVSTIDTKSITRDRLTGAHPSSYLFKSSFLTKTVGMVSEEIPYGYGEDYDLLIRAAARGKISILPEAAVNVLWHPGGSYFSRRWEAMEAGISFLIDKHPQLTESNQTASWLHGQRAFALASLKDRKREGLRAARKSIRLNPRQPRGYLAFAVAIGLLRSQWVVDRLNERGKGI